MKKIDIINGCIDMVAISGRLFAIFEDAGFRKIASPVLKAIDCTVNKAIVREKLILRATNLRENMSKELKINFFV